jgi:hypothetical protein
MLQKEIVLLLFPVPADALKRIVPPGPVTAEIDDPRTVHRVTVLLDAPLVKRMVQVPDAPETLVLEIVRELPPLLSPSIVTLSAPFRSINGLPAAIAPDTVRAAPPEGSIRIDV